MQGSSDHHEAPQPNGTSVAQPSRDGTDGDVEVHEAGFCSRIVSRKVTARISTSTRNRNTSFSSYQPPRAPAKPDMAANEKSSSDNADVSQPFSIYSRSEKAFLVTLVSFAATFSGFASNIYFPCLPTIASDLSVSTELINLTVTSYMIFQGLTPTLWGAIADVKGRRLVYICTFLVFFSACIGLAETRNYAMLVVLRCLQSTGSASTIAVGSGVIGDITTRAERGGLMGIFQAGLLVPVAIGPVIGGALSNSLGWRSIFWFLAIYSGIFILVLLVCFPETLQALVGNGSVQQQGLLRYPLSYFQKRYHARTTIPPQTTLAPPKSISILLPFLVLADSSIVPVISCLAVHYAVWQMSITVLSTLMQSIYGLGDVQTGLTFIGNGIGSMLGTILTGKLLDLQFARAVKKSNGESPSSRSRLRSVWLWSAIQTAAILMFGWTLERQVHLSAPIIATFFIGWAAMAIQSTISTYLVDEFPEKSASASAALNLVRCLLGAAGTAAVLPMIKGIGTGWCFTLLSGIMACSLVIMLLCVRIKKSEQIRV